MNVWYELAAELVFESMPWPLIQLTILLTAGIFVHSMLRRQRAAIRHAVLGVTLIAAPIVLVAGAFRLKPEFIIPIAVAEVSGQAEPGDVISGVRSTSDQTIEQNAATTDLTTSPDALLCLSENPTGDSTEISAFNCPTPADPGLMHRPEVGELGQIAMKPFCCAPRSFQAHRAGSISAQGNALGFDGCCRQPALKGRP
jgi:hypothetical protein